jgi:uncharacterized protein YfaQ (DUF2300 family)
MTATTTANPVARRLVALVAAALLVLSLGAVPAQAQTQEGLVNVNLDGVNVQLPIAIAANVCDVNVNALAEQLRDGGAECDADATSDAVIDDGDECEAPTQEGLVNVNVSCLFIQVPVAVAANICDVNVNVLARQLRSGGAECVAVADSDANV